LRNGGSRCVFSDSHKTSRQETHTRQQGFILATLISTIAGTFTTGINLYDRIVEKRKQAKLDKGQDEKIRDLERRVHEHHGHNGHHKHRHGYDNDDDRLRQSLQYGGSSVKNEYDRHYAELGSRYAEGDITAQLQLQSAIITLQQTVIKVLEEALYSGQPPDISKLDNASEFARQGSVRALRDQYRRMLEGSAGPGNRSPAGPIRRVSSTSALDDRERERMRALPAPSLGSHAPGDDAGPLFCEAAVELQEEGSLRVDKILAPGPKALIFSRKHGLFSAVFAKTAPPTDAKTAFFGTLSRFWYCFRRGIRAGSQGPCNQYTRLIQAAANCKRPEN